VWRRASRGKEQEEVNFDAREAPRCAKLSYP
jgi:hypothetical protein